MRTVPCPHIRCRLTGCGMSGDHWRVASLLSRGVPLLVSVLAMLAATLAGAHPARAEIVVTGETKAVSFKLTIADTLKGAPVLFSNLEAEGQAWITKGRHEAEQEYSKDPSFFADGRIWSLERSYTLLSTVGPFVSVLRTDYAFQGGAHPNTVVDTILWDDRTHKRVSMRPFFTETKDGGPTMTALARLIRDAVAKEKRARGIEVAANPARDEWLKAIEPSLLKLGPLALARSTESGMSGGLTVHFSPYAVGPYAEGRFTVVIPWRGFAEYLSPEGRMVFGGEPIKPDTKDD